MTSAATHAIASSTAGPSTASHSDTKKMPSSPSRPSSSATLYAVAASPPSGLSEAESGALVGLLEKALAHLRDRPRTTICRLCDTRRCERDDCPVIERQIELGETPPRAVPVED